MGWDDLIRRKKAKELVRAPSPQAQDADARMAQLAKRKKVYDPVRNEIERIISLPIVPILDGEEFEEFCHANMLAHAFDAGERFYKPQASAIKAYDEYGGMFGPIGVGWGKTGVSIVTADHAFKAGVRKSLMLIPPNVWTQLTQVDIAWWRKRVPIAVPFHLLGRRTRAQRLSIANSDRHGCYIMPYSLLSRPDTMDMLHAIDADLIIADEVHMVSRRSAGRTRRFLHFIDEKNKAAENDPSRKEVQLVGMSGTITDKGIDDYQHLLARALKMNSPIPITQSLAREWGCVIDSDVGEVSDRTTGPIMPLVRWAQKNFPEEKRFRESVADFRRAYKLRLTSAPGVVATGDNEIGVSLSINNMPVEACEKAKGWHTLTSFMDQVSDTYVTPNGDEIDHAMHTFKWLYELSAGFYNQLTWPCEVEYAERIGVSDDEAKDILERAQKHHELHQDYVKKQRRYIQYDPKASLYTPMEVARRIHEGDTSIPDDVDKAYWDAKAAEFEGMPERDSTVVRVCPYKIDDGLLWGATHGAGIMWCHSREIASWLYEALLEADLNPLFCPAGADDAIMEVGDPNRGGKGDRLVVASISAHYQSKNLQAFTSQYFMQWPRNSKIAEQVLGRTHRNGQTADSLSVHTNNTTVFDHINFAACLNDAIYTQQSTSLRQKIVYAVHDPLPRVFSPEFLREQGATPKILNRQQREMLTERFGDWESKI